MKNKKTIIVFILGALAVAVTLGTVAYQSVLAATPAITTTGITTQADTALAIGKGPGGSYTNEELAKALGITTDELTTAFQTATKAALAEAVSQGLITQTQSDQLTTNGSAFPFGGRWEEFLSTNGIDFNTFLADALNISVDELKSAYQTANFAHIDQAVTDGDLTQEQADLMKGRYALYSDSTFQSSMQSAYTDAVNQAVASGVITQSQADQILSTTNNMFRFGMEGLGGPGGGHGGHRGPGGPGGDWMNGGTLPTTP